MRPDLLTALVALGCAIAPFAQAGGEEFILPSGLRLSLEDRIVEPQAGGEVWLTLRYVSPMIGNGQRGYDEISEDLDRLCDEQGLAAVREVGGADQVMITLMDRAVVRGTIDPEATVYIGAYRPTEEGCTWE